MAAPTVLNHRVFRDVNVNVSSENFWTFAVSKDKGEIIGFSENL